jgi:branched-chain amino acid transport system substrate-binding protein
MKKGYLLGVVLLILVIALLVPACSSSTPATSTAPTSAVSQQTIKVGLIGFLGWPLGLDMMHGVEIMVAADNAAGGLSIGGKKYQVQLVEYDSKADQSTTVAAANKLIFEDKVSFILSDSQFIDAWLPIADSNKVIGIGQMVSQDGVGTKYKYVFDGPYMNAQNCVLPGWYATNNPTKKNILVALPDTQMGHAQAPSVESSFQAFGINATSIFYPQNQQDQSALGTKVKTTNPDAFTALAGGPVGDGLCYKAAYQAGYRGTFFASNAAPLLSLSQVIPVEALEGFINMAWPVEFDTPPTQMSKDFKAAYIAKYGKWDGPDIMDTANYALLRTALQAAGSLDVDKVAGVISNGLKYEGPTGVGQMISRPDLGQTRTTDSISSYYFKVIKGGQASQLTQVSLEDALKYFRLAWPTK